MHTNPDTSTLKPGFLPAAQAAGTALLLAGCLLALPAAAQDEPQHEPPPGFALPEEPVPPPPHMPDAIRSDARNVVVIAGRRPARQDVGGSYARDTPGLVGGMASGSRLGRIETEVAQVPIYIPIPGLALPGAIVGGLSGATRRQIQEFRDALTEELASADNTAIKDDGLAIDVFWGLRKLPDLDSKLYSPTTPVPEETDAVLYVNFNDISIDVQGKEAVITTTAKAELQRLSDGAGLYVTALSYQDRDTLRNWTENDNALWRDYANYARHYLGRAVAADLYGLVVLQHELHPLATDTASVHRKDERRYVSRTTTPTLAWELALAGNDPEAPWSATIGEPDIFYDVEIYDARQLVYFEEQVPEPRHTLAMELEPCQTYRWSVRPSYRVGNAVRFGHWMRYPAPVAADDEEEPAEPAKTLVGRQASVAPAYTQDFALLEIECGRR